MNKLLDYNSIEWNDYFYLDEASPSGLRWKVDRKSGKNNTRTMVSAGDNTVLSCAIKGCKSDSYLQPKDFRLKPERHIHQDLIDAYNKGAKIQMYLTDNWIDVEPQWAENREYRVKPSDINMYTELNLTSLSDAVVEHGWSMTRWDGDNIKAVFCSETNELLSIELLKD